MKTRKAIVFCEVTCSNCSGVEFEYYRNAATIRRLKEKTSDWVDTDEYGTLCPECQKKLGIRKE